MSRRSPHALVVRDLVPADAERVKELACATGLFGPDEVGFLDELVGGMLAGDRPQDRWYVVERAGTVVGVAYVAPEPYGDRVWNLYLLATDPASHGSGAGTLLVGRVEEHLRALGAGAAQVLLVETSGTERFAGARRFYQRRGFHRESTIRDYYGTGDDKVTYWKALNRRVPAARAPGRPREPT